MIVSPMKKFTPLIVEQGGGNVKLHRPLWRLALTLTLSQWERGSECYPESFASSASVFGFSTGVSTTCFARFC